MTSTFIPDAILHTVRRSGLLKPSSRVGVAVSGGVDSVVLLDVLLALRSELELDLAVVHFNHALRGEESVDDATFVESLASAAGLPFLLQSAAEPLTADIEQGAREARYSFFAKLVRTGLIEQVATGHTLSDQAETVLGRLLRGSGLAGLAGILPSTAEGVIRPMLGCSRSQVESWATSRGLVWREDRTNTNTRFLRNRIRHELLPLACDIAGASVPRLLATTASLARDEEEYWQEEIERLFGGCARPAGSAVLLEAPALAAMHPAVARRLLRRCIAAVRGNLRSIDVDHVNGILALARQGEGHGRLQVPGLDVFRSFDLLRIAAPATATRFERSWCHGIPEGSQWRIRVPTADGASIELETGTLAESQFSDNRYNENLDVADFESLPAGLEIRNWQPGDMFQPPGRNAQRLKALFQEGRVPIWERSTWPVLAAGSLVIWTRLWGTAHPYLPGMTTQVLLRIREIPPEVGGQNESDDAAEASNG